MTPEFLGGPCGRCGARGWYWHQLPHQQNTTRVTESQCPARNGTSRTQGHAAALSRWPVERVRLVDREPFATRWGDDDQPVYTWLRCTRAIPATPNDVPLALWADELGMDFDSPEQAQAALSGRCLAHLASLRAQPATVTQGA